MIYSNKSSSRPFKYKFKISFEENTDILENTDGNNSND
jgi:hypothetical protein